MESTKLLSHNCRTIKKKKDFLFFSSNLRDGQISITFRRSAKKLKFLTSNVPRNFSRGPTHMFKVPKRSAYVRAFQCTNSRGHMANTEEMVQEKQKTVT